MSDARFIRRWHFSASHRYGRADWSTERNRSVFGAQMDIHEHDWMLEVHTVGPIDPDTGFSVDLSAVDRIVGDMTEGWDGGDLNVLIPEVASGSLVPTTESLARWAYMHLESRISPPARLVRVALFESPTVGSQYPAEESP
ncbi:MAG: 6-carboxytetrahydropterin synthase [Gemmatimonadales bacterium]|jgi:6-pyruvoyltetrahydropterin/6-carboxytetrahydropterin synthase|nr:6-carboxytetrahydropterin synthase [Gemmatimonadales bacterium]MDG2241078.1 6-carboxytetrahydropterin synthase [Longimicrobiales bacterium]NCG34089.1 hypothetical protein [Pseudomonadota bacterium]MBT3499192.1 6-carboxytetrahydropterin synthase [Gemmatimonadales bacterium]MBT3776201.1 6-carboxytetrahydropterin synthase [Gemmatimonadales bacterium]